MKVKNNLIFNRFKTLINLKDEEFDEIYPSSIKELSDIHWTPVEVALKAAKLLVNKPKTKVLDIGSGSGKFCLVGASTTEGEFTGIEYKESLVNISKELIQEYNIQNFQILQDDITNIEFSEYDAFYFFNSFEENLFNLYDERDIESHKSFLNYKKYTKYVYHEFKNLKIGTKIVTYYTPEKQIPDNYQLKEVHFDGLLKLWVKNKE